MEVSPQPKINLPSKMQIGEVILPLVYSAVKESFTRTQLYIELTTTVYIVLLSTSSMSDQVEIAG